MALDTRTHVGWHLECGGAVHTVSLGSYGQDRLCDKCQARKSNGSLGLDKVVTDPYDIRVKDLIAEDILLQIQQITKAM